MSSEPQFPQLPSGGDRRDNIREPRECLESGRHVADLCLFLLHRPGEGAAAAFLWEEATLRILDVPVALWLGGLLCDSGRLPPCCWAPHGRQEAEDRRVPFGGDPGMAPGDLQAL